MTSPSPAPKSIIPPRSIVLCVALCAIAACGGDDPSGTGDETVARKSIGAEGGVVEIPTARVEIPAGALSETVEITIERIGTAPAGDFSALSSVHVFGPAGQQFAQPVSVSMSFSGLVSSPTIWWADAVEGPWEALDSTSSDGRVTASTVHFSAGVVGTPESEPIDVGDADATEDVSDTYDVEDVEEDIDADTEETSDTDAGCTDCGPSILALSTGHYHTCALREGDELWCWGRNDYGQTGSESAEPVSLPRRVGDRGQWTAMDAGNSFTCGIQADGSLWCWGRNDYAQIAPSVEGASFSAPKQVGEATHWHAVSAGVDSACAITDADALWCWGSNSFGVGGIGTTGGTIPPSELPGTWESVAVGDYHACGVQTGGTLWCWGSNGYGQIAAPSETSQLNAPTQVGEATDWVAAFPSGYSACAVREDGELWCWGGNQSGQLGDGETDAWTEPTLFGVDGPWIDVALGHTLESAAAGVKSDGSLWSWGLGYVGRGESTETISTPTPVATASNFTTVDAGHSHLCTANDLGEVWCWGDNTYGQLGDGTLDEALQPVIADFDAGCEGETDEQFCRTRGAQCGELTALDWCGEERTVDCGGCANGDCGECADGPCDEGVPNRCPCIPDGSGETVCE
jgi:alpha-tubulin suppressor-like RCC1 family protein